MTCIFLFIQNKTIQTFDKETERKKEKLNNPAEKQPNKVSQISNSYEYGGYRGGSMSDRDVNYATLVEEE